MKKINVLKVTVNNNFGYNTSKGSDIMSKTSNDYIRLEPEVKIPSKKPLVYEDLSEEDFDREILKAMDDFDNGRTYTVEEVEKNLEDIYTKKY